MIASRQVIVLRGSKWAIVHSDNKERGPPEPSKCELGEKFV